MSSKKVLWALSIVAAVVVTLIVAKAVRAADTVVPGSYLVHAKVPQTMPGFPTTFDQLAVFTSDGTIIEVDQGNAVHANHKGQGSPALGAWQFGAGGVDITLWSLWASRDSGPLGVLRVRGHGAPNPDRLGEVDGTAMFEFFNNGNDPTGDKPDLTVNGGTFTAKRLKVMPVQPVP